MVEQGDGSLVPELERKNRPLVPKPVHESKNIMKKG